jgi:aminoglycoside phosphotransferase family enzyme
MNQFNSSANRRAIPDRRAWQFTIFPLRDSTGSTVLANRRLQDERRLHKIKVKWVPPHILKLGKDATINTAARNEAENSEDAGGFQALPDKIMQDLMVLKGLLEEKQDEQAMEIFEKLKHKAQQRRSKISKS